MLVFGTPDMYKYLSIEIGVVLNFNSLLEGVRRLDALNPYWSVANQVFTNEAEFDQWYIEYITTTPDAFKQMIDLIRLVYNGENVFVLCDFDNEIHINMIEALVKFIVDSYGYISNICKSEADLSNLKEGRFSADGIQMFDSNMMTYISMFGMKNLPSLHGAFA